MQSVLKKINVFGDETELFDAIHPIGETYTQYPGQKNPNELWGGSSHWEVVQYKGTAFRAAGGMADAFEKKLTISSFSGRNITFTTNHGLNTGSLIYDYTHNEGRIVTAIINTTTVQLNSVFTYSDMTDVFVTQNDSLKSHSHNMNHGHSASSSSSCYGVTQPTYGIYIKHSAGSLTYDGYPTIYMNDVDYAGYSAIGRFIFNMSLGSSTTVYDYNGNTGNYGDNNTHSCRFPYLIWERVS